MNCLFMYSFSVLCDFYFITLTTGAAKKKAKAFPRLGQYLMELKILFDSSRTSRTLLENRQ